MHKDDNMKLLDQYTIKEIITLLEKRIDSFWIDVKMGHIQRVVEGIDKHYVDENQALIVIDHLMRIRAYQEVITDLKLKLYKE